MKVTYIHHSAFAVREKNKVFLFDYFLGELPPFEEDDEIVIVDYKTDYITEENKQEVIDRYKKQLDLYAEALTKLTGKKVKEKYLYLFNVDEAVKLEED